MKKLNFKEKLAKIKGIVLDVDGVLTDGGLTIMPDGSVIRKVNAKDGYALQQATQNGLTVGIISGGNMTDLMTRFNYLGIKRVYTGSVDKLNDFEDFLILEDLKAENVLYMGDDVPDLGVMKACGIATSPINACNDVLKVVEYVSPFKGGEGCALWSTTLFFVRQLGLCQH